MVTLSRILTGIALVATIQSATLAQNVDTTRATAPDFQIEKRDGRIRMRQVSPSVPHAPTSTGTTQQMPTMPLRTTGETVERTVAASKQNDWKSEIHAVVNPHDSTNIIAGVMASSPSGYLDMHVYTSFDFGTTWQQTATLPSGNDPMFTVDDKGTIYLFYLVPAGFDDVKMFYRYSTDKGKTWQKPTSDIISTEQTSDKEWAAADNNPNSPYKGTVYLAFLSGDFLVLHSKKPDSTSFSTTPVRLTDGSFTFEQLVSLTIAPDGAIHAAFTGAQESNDKVKLWHTVSTDGGAAFSTPTKVAELATTIEGYFDPSLKTPGFKSIPSSLLVSSPEDGSLHLIWHDIVIENNRATASNIYYTRSTDKGVTWATPRQLNDNQETEGYYHYLPSLAINADGVVCASWYDGRAEKNSAKVNISTTYSLDNGISFVPYITANEAPANLATMEDNFFFTVGHYTQLVCTDGYAIPFWSDGRTGDAFHLYCAFVPLNPTITSVERVVRMSPHHATLAIVPHPVADNAAITLTLATPAHAQLRITDITGKTVATLLNQYCSAGDTHVQLSAHQLVHGTYFCSLYTDGILATTQQLTIKR